MKLGNRMAAIAALVATGSRIADIGTDHGYIPIYLITNNISLYAVAGEVHPGPYNSALDTVKRLGLADKIAVRYGDGFDVLNLGEVDTAIIAGMGGANIIEILTKRPEITKTISRLILQPMIAAAPVRQWLLSNGWRLIKEDLVIDEGRLYEIIAAEPGQASQIEPVLLDIGPLLWTNRHPLLKNHIESLIAQYRRIVEEMSASSQAVNTDKYREYCQKITQLEEKLSCL